MRKTDKKRNNALREILTQVCETALKDIEGFRWLTHRVDHAQFPQSLRIVCVFETNAELNRFLDSQQSGHLVALVNSELKTAGFTLKKPDKHLHYDTEEACLEQHAGNWARRLGPH